MQYVTGFGLRNDVSFLSTTSRVPSLLQKLKQLRPLLAQAAQAVIDEWVQDDEGLDGDLGAGGACDVVSQAMSAVIGSFIPDADVVDGGHDGDDHMWLIVVSGSEAVGVDIPPGVYETGGGYSWKKIDDAKIESADVAIWKIDRRDVTASVVARRIVAARRPNVGKLTSQNGEKRVPLFPAEETKSAYVADVDGQKVKFPKKTMRADVDGRTWTLSDVSVEDSTNSPIDSVLIDRDPDFRAVLQMLNDHGFRTHSSCSGHSDRPGTPYISITTDLKLADVLSGSSFVKDVRPDPSHSNAVFVSFDRKIIGNWSELLEYLRLVLEPDVARRIAAKYSYEGQFVFQGRTYDMKVRNDGQGAVVYQKSPKCLFVKDGDEWLFQAGSKAVYDAAMKHLKREKTAADPDDLRLQEGPAFHLKPDGTWGVEDVPPSVARDARFSGFLAIEGYWCAVFELGGEEWAEKAAGEMPPETLASVAQRVASRWLNAAGK